MTCSHVNADDFEIEDFPCYCGYKGYVRFVTCSCTTDARGTCENCGADIVIDRRREDVFSGNVWP